MVKFQISNTTAYIIGGLIVCAVLVDSYMTRSAMSERIQVVEEEVEQTASDIQELKNIFVNTDERISYTPKDYECLAKNIYHEAGVESKMGKVAVGQVTINRLKSKRWGTSLCDVVYAKEQFSWTISKKLKNEKPTGELWVESRRIANQVLSGLRIQSLYDSLFYHTDYIKKPVWADDKSLITQIDQHKFYTKAKFALRKKQTPKNKHHHTRT